MKKLFVVTVVFVLIILLLRQAKNAYAAGPVTDFRSNACRTYHTFSHQKEQDTRQEIDGESCGNVEQIMESNDHPAVMVINPPNVENPVIPGNNPENPPVIVPVDDSKGNNGHGNNQDGCDSSNPSGKCPHGGTDESAPTDDEKEHKNK